MQTHSNVSNIGSWVCSDYVAFVTFISSVKFAHIYRFYVF